MLIFLSWLLLPAAAEVGTYRAAVADLTSQDTVRQTLTHYDALTKEAKADRAQIIVFPEALTWDDESRRQAKEEAQKIPAEGSLPCDGGDAAMEFQQVQYISCMARKHSIVVVANVLDKVPCSDARCPKDKLLIYNTAIALNETGHLVAVYHKRHDYLPLDQPPLVPKSFETSFGVKFGLIVCYDLTFLTPVDALIDQGIRNFAFTTNWDNEVPLQTATLSQQGWSRWYGANLLASNDAGDLTTSGSGIYTAGEVLARRFQVNGTWPAPDRVLLANVPKTPAHQPLTAEWRSRQELLPNTKVSPRDLNCSIHADDAARGVCTILPMGSVGKVNLSVSDGLVKCSAYVDIAAASIEDYVLYASSWRVKSKRATDLDVCALMVCQRRDISVHGHMKCKPVFSGTLILHSLRLDMIANTAKAVVPFVGVGMSENLPRNATDVLVNHGSYSMASTSAWSGEIQDRGLLSAALYGTDAVAPEMLRPSFVV